MMGRRRGARKCMKQISRMKSRMGFHPERGCGIVKVAKERYGANSLLRAIRWPVVVPCTPLMELGMTDRTA